MSILAGPQDSAGGPAVRPSVAQRVFQAQVETLYRLAPASLVFSVVASALVCWLLLEAVPAALLGWWFGFAVLLNLMRLGLVWARNRAPDAGQQPYRWARWFVVGVFFNGALWGLCGTVLMPRANPELAYALLVILGVIPGIAISSLSPLRAAHTAFILPFLGPVAVQLFWAGRPDDIVIGVSALIFTIVLFVIGRRGERDVIESFTRRFENEDLLVEVRQAQARAEQASRELALEVAQRQSAQEQLLLAKNAAERANHAKSQFLANTTHEIRTPMNGVLGMNELLLSSPLQPEQRAWAEAVQMSGRHLLAVINDILDFSKIESDQLALDPVDFDLAPVLRDVLAMLQPAASAKGLDLSCQLEPAGTAQALHGDPLRLRQVLANLVGNAVKFTERGQVRIRVVQQQAVQGMVALGIGVEDTGIGIPAEALGRIFERFSQADGSTTRRYGGSGLGLAICKHLVEQMGGTIRVHSEPGRGSTFHVDLCLPVAHRPLPVLADGGDDAVAGAVGGSGLLRGRVLLVEDNPVNRRVGAAMLEHLGLQCELADDGAQGLERMRAGGVDLVLMDCQMPVMDGYETTEAIRALPDALSAKVPIVALTANTMHGDEQRCLDAGMDAFLAKPYTIASLRAMLARWLPTPDIGAAPGVVPPSVPDASPTPRPRPGAGAAINPAIIDTLRGLDASGGMGLAREVFGIFLGSAQRAIEQVQAAIDAEDVQALGHVAHAMKSSAANVGAEALSACYRELELAQRGGRMDAVCGVFQRLRPEHERAVARIGDLLKDMH